MEFFEVINTRHMYRGNFLNEKVSDEDIRKIIMPGVKAPQAVNECSTSYIVVDKLELIKEMGKLLPMNGTGTAPCIIQQLKPKFEEVVTYNEF